MGQGRGCESTRRTDRHTAASMVPRECEEVEINFAVSQPSIVDV